MKDGEVFSDKEEVEVTIVLPISGRGNDLAICM